MTVTPIRHELSYDTARHLYYGLRWRVPGSAFWIGLTRSVISFYFSLVRGMNSFIYVFDCSWFCEYLPYMWPGCKMVLRPYVTVGMFYLCFVPYAPLCESGIWSRGGYFAYFRKKKRLSLLWRCLSWLFTARNNLPLSRDWRSFFLPPSFQVSVRPLLHLRRRPVPPPSPGPEGRGSPLFKDPGNSEGAPRWQEGNALREMCLLSRLPVNFFFFLKDRSFAEWVGEEIKWTLYMEWSKFSVFIFR